MEPIKTLTYPKGITVKIFQDPYPVNPRENDNLGTMALFHRRMRLGDVDHGLTVEKAVEIEKDKNVICLPVYAYEHGGIVISTSNDHYPFTCPWDAGQVGWIFATREKLLQEYKAKRLTQRIIAQATEALEAEVQEYDRYLRGEVYRYEIENASGEFVDSCCGYFDLDYLKEELQRAA